MSLIIEPGTTKAETQISTIKWCQDQLNAVLEQFFNNKYRVLKGLKLEFRMKLDTSMNETVKLDISELAPETEERFNEAVEEAKLQLDFKKDEVITGQVIEGEQNGPR